VIVKLPELAFCWLSVAEQFTVLVPSGNVEPAGGLQLGVTGPSTTSLAVAWYVTGAPFGPVASAVVLPGSASTGAVVSCMSIVKARLALLPAVSAAEQVTVLRPRGKVEPEAGEHVTTTLPSTMSWAVGDE